MSLMIRARFQALKHVRFAFRVKAAASGGFTAISALILRQCFANAENLLVAPCTAELAAPCLTRDAAIVPERELESGQTGHMFPQPAEGAVGWLRVL